MSALLSVIMPTYNGEQFLPAALDSVCIQNDPNLELIVVDDGSTDRTLEIIASYSQRLPIRLLTPGRLGNWVATTNLGLREARGEWACFLHQDDLWLPGRLARLHPEMARTDTSFLLHHASFIDLKGRELGPWTCPLKDGLVEPHEFLERLLVQNFIAIPSPVFRLKPVLDSGCLDPALWFSADWDLWLRLGALGPVRLIDQILGSFRVHPTSQTAARRIGTDEWQQQLSTVVERHMPAWQELLDVQERRGAAELGKLRSHRTRNYRRHVERAAQASIAVNSGLAALSRGETVAPAAVLLPLLVLGPAGLRRYLRDSRIIERVGSRLKAQCLNNNRKNTHDGQPAGVTG